MLGFSGVDDGGVNGILANVVWGSYNGEGGCARERKEDSVGSQTVDGQITPTVPASGEGRGYSSEEEEEVQGSDI
jgi:hypothetical protein